ncbi:helix-turn-helix domain-containing protein [Ammoniphilus resinae]|uniref:Transcriptional regulator with XRE-family HTH domain n=1 Tax=Ammoniphilus resinae TaxID=861532 RepID=A0ABS4GX37_9BACL|nr:helix-turn-helix transcriptional regulator [Ammoniphilus resinae]MBP1934834.1 transcriptional regulator with XRE-family HTH domain [Ammoniphilus resinae]
MSYAADVLAAMIEKDLAKKGLTYEQFADKTGIGKTTVYSLLKGTANPSLSTIELVTKEIGRHILVLHLDEIQLRLEELMDQDIREVQAIVGVSLSTKDPDFVKFTRENIADLIVTLQKLYDSFKTLK